MADDAARHLQYEYKAVNILSTILYQRKILWCGLINKLTAQFPSEFQSRTPS